MIEETFNPWDPTVMNILQSDYHKFFIIDSPSNDEYSELKIVRDTE